MRLLVADDEREMAALLRTALEESGYEVDVATSGERAIDAAHESHYDAIVLDVMLPGLDGFTTCRRLRARGVGAPILMLTARGALADRVNGLDAGADDYLAKPFSLDELLARVRALLRRGPVETTSRVAVGDLELDTSELVARRGSFTVALTPREAAVLQLLMSRPGRTIARDEIVRRAWDDETELRSNSIEVLVNRIRHKLQRPDGIAQIETVRGVGYRFLRP